MMTADQTQTQVTLGFLESYTDARTGLMPARAPLADLPSPFDGISKACSELPQHFCEPAQDCRPWLDQQFSELDPAWAEALEQAPEFLLDNIMSKVSLLCHAYRWGKAPSDEEPSQGPLPPGLDWLWTQTADRLEVPRVGSYHSLLINNWSSPEVEPGSAYELDHLKEGTVEPMVGWLTPPAQDALDNYLSTMVKIEVKGVRIVQAMKELYECMVRGDTQEATYHLMVLSANILAVNTGFNRSFKHRAVNRTTFNSQVRPLLLWSEEPDQLRGSHDLQSCTVQLLESCFGFPVDSEFGTLLLEQQKYLKPAQRKLLKVVEQNSPVLRRFVEEADSIRLTEAYNRCLSLMQTRRLSNLKRGALLTSEEKKLKLSLRGETLENKWEGREWSLDFLFRFLTPQQRAILTRNTEQIKYYRGEVIIQQGNLFPGLFELSTGSATVRKMVGEQEEIVDRMGINEVFGEMSLVENLPASASIVAEEDSQARQISLETVYDLINEHRDAEAGFYLALAQLISHRFRKTFPVK
ncbi:MAG: cyclic nucleotide-binding domain-containing protein [Vulcanimicrobiota bacterium]